MFRTPKRAKTLDEESETVIVTPPSRNVKIKVNELNEKSPVNGSTNMLSPNETRRGRPRAEVLTTLIKQGSTSPSSIKCSYCHRVFPREKSLQAHLRTHTGEKPYVCDYPRCTRKFAQSGQLKTHQRLHTGEKPFICAFPNCQRRFTHANRHCPEHPDMTLKRFSTSLQSSNDKINDEEHSNAVQKWLDSIKRRDKNELMDTPKKFGTLLRERKVQDENYSPLRAKSLENQFNADIGDMCGLKLEIHQHSEEYASAEAMIELHNSSYQSPGTPQVSKECNELPKKRWLREALDQQRSDDVLAKPIKWDNEKHLVEHENKKRPTVLVCVGEADKKEITKADIQTAMALVELSNSTKYSF